MNPSRLKGSQGVTPFLKVTDHAADAARYGISWYEARWKTGNTNFHLW
jgi:hypothetical protein